MAMDFFRRPALVGKANVGRLAVGKVRGTVRRTDADGTSAVPYFPALSATQTLLVTTQDVNVVAGEPGPYKVSVRFAVDDGTGVIQNADTLTVVETTPALGSFSRFG